MREDLHEKLPTWDAIIVGGGPAGLNAALILGGCRRNGLPYDSGKPRNAVSKGMHGFLSRDGIAPHEFIALGCEQLQEYSSVTVRGRCAGSSSLPPA